MSVNTPRDPFSWKRLLLHLLLFESICLLLCYAGEFRFCYKGPQRILYKDCPGGFVAKETVKATCMYYYKAENVPNMETFLSDNICEQELNMRQLDPDYHDFTTTEFQMIEFDPDTNSGPTDGSDPAFDKCNASCLADWLEPKNWNPQKVFKDKADLNDTAVDEFRKDYVELTKTILIKIINEDEFDEDLDLGEPGPGGTIVPRSDFLMQNSTIVPQLITNLMKILAKSMRITYKKCTPFIEPSFYTLVFRTMIEFRRMNDNFPDMNILPLKRIMKILNKCESEQVPYFMLNGTRCEDKFVVQSITNIKENHTFPLKMRENSFRWGRYDPIIEAAWSAIVFVHAYCFDFFVKDMLHFSLYIKGMTEIFVQPIVEKHWMYPFPVGQGMTLWEMAYDTPDIQNQMNNLDSCVEGAYAGSVFDTRLDRPFNKQEFFDNPEYQDDPNIPAPGWNKSLEEYWQMYEAHGFQEMVEALGYCAPTLDAARTKAEEFAEETCFIDFGSGVFR